MKVAVALALVASVVVLGGCGGDDGESAATTSGGGAPATDTAAATDAGAVDGAEVFATAGCANCHTLAAAGSTGTVGPNLDERKPSKERVVTQVTNGGGVMPSFEDELSEAQIEAVAEYVSSSAGG